MLSMKKAFLITLICLVEPATAQWSYVGLGGTQVSGLTICSDTIYASTFDGLYKKYVLSIDTTWEPCGMQGNHVVQTVVPDGQTFISLVEEDSGNLARIYKSTNGGISFGLMDTSAGLVGYDFLQKIAHPEGNYDTLYFVSHQRRTFDGGATWETMDDVGWGHFIEVNPGNHSQIIVGGEGFMLNAIMAVSSDYGTTWTFANMNGYFGGDNALHALAINGSDWFGAGEGVICKTNDGGNNWSQLINTWSYPAQWQLYIFGIDFSPADHKRIYATGDGRGTSKVPLLYSADYGTTWDTLSCAGNGIPHILALAVKNTASGDRVFLGGSGVFLYENIFTGVHDRTPAHPDHYSLANNYPNPFNPSTTIEFSLPKRNHVTLRVFTVLGQILTTLVDEDLTTGTYKVRWNAGEHASGIYYYRMDAGAYSNTKKLLLMK